MDGTVAWLTGRIVKTHCECDIRFYPFDTQTCGLIFSTWLYNKQSIQLKTPSPAMFGDFYKENGEWEYLRYDTELKEVRSGGALYEMLHLNLTFRRRPSFYFMNYILVGALLSWLLCLTFKLAPDSGDKIGFVLTVLLTYTVYLAFVLDNIPRTSQRTSMLEKFNFIHIQMNQRAKFRNSTNALTTTMVINIIFGVIATAISVFVLKCNAMPPEEPIPRWLKNLIKYVLKPILGHKQNGRVCFCCFKNKKKNKIDMDAAEIKNKMESWIEKDHGACSDDLSWPEVGQIVDDITYIDNSKV
ncbi:hypothetical protein KUTeg_009903 [Tegillarca granosa]|uniref:Uncharacterized protein n=1 Tax=Tegillarca granosa TaxID=220873 RepID=A0ABQ9F576_TEGGR|nr:hypothetical protein KUTeg_009903 [Tegillarca granosa]